MQKSLTETTIAPKPRRWLVIFDYIFYVALFAAAAGFAYYIYYYLTTPIIPGTPILTYIPFLLQAAVTTIVISVLSMILSTIFGFIGALGRLSRFAPIRWLAFTYVEVVRGVPVLVQLLFWYYGVGQLLSSLGFDPYNAAFQFMTYLNNNSLVPDAFSAYFYGIIGLSFNYGAYLTEVFRAGIESVDRGQTEAALSLGLNGRQTMRHIILPQAIRITLPPFTNYFITLVQDSALLSVLGIVELEEQIGALAYPQVDSNLKLFIFVLGAIVYFIICYSLALLARYLESRFARAYQR